MKYLLIPIFFALGKLFLVFSWILFLKLCPHEKTIEVSLKLTLQKLYNGIKASNYSTPEQLYTLEKSFIFNFHFNEILLHNWMREAASRGKGKFLIAQLSLTPVVENKSSKNLLCGEFCIQGKIFTQPKNVIIFVCISWLFLEILCSQGTKWLYRSARWYCNWLGMQILHHLWRRATRHHRLLWERSSLQPGYHGLWRVHAYL